MRPNRALTVLPLLIASPAIAQELLETSTYSPSSGFTWMRFGSEIETVGDLDGDGMNDLAMHAPGSHHLEPASGWIRVLSSRTGEPLLSVRLSAVDDTYVDLADAGDVDADGVPDLIAGFSESKSQATGEYGQVHVYSGRTGRRIHVQYGTDGTFKDDRLGSSVGGVGDLNGDGYADFCAGAPGYDTNGIFGLQQDAGAVFVWSGKDGSLISIEFQEGSPKGFGYDLANVGDQNGDGLDDLVVTVPGSNSAYRISPGTSNAKVALLPPGLGYATSLYGDSVVALGDQDGDGRMDVAISDPVGKVVNQTKWGMVHLQRALNGAHFGTYAWSSFLGIDDHLFFGRILAAVGDVNGDGRDDLLAAGWSEDPTFGGVQLGAPAKLISPSTGQELVVWDGDAQDWVAEADWSPNDFSAAGDSDGDGLDEFFRARSSLDTTFGTYAGRIERLEKNPFLPILDLLDTFHPGHAPGFGSAIDLIEDLDGDGAPEQIVGAPHHGASSSFDNGRVQVISNGVVLHELTGASLDRLGAAVCAIDDVTGDGIADFLVGKPGAKVGLGQRGIVTLHSGNDASVVRTHLGQDPNEDFGAAIAAVPDLNGDGVRDYAIGAPFAASLAGRVRVFSGASGAELWSVQGSSRARLGSALAGSTDLNGDGRGDLIAGAPGATLSSLTPEAGRVVRYSGANGAVLGANFGTQAQARLGSAVAAVGDVNGDGISDYLVGSPGHDGVGADDGLVELRSGASGNLLGSFAGVFGERLGTAVCAAGDLDHDGAPDFALGAPLALTDFFSGERAGRVRLVSGKTLSDHRVLFGAEDLAGFGRTLAGGVDVDLDGLPDVAIGVPLSEHPVAGFSGENPEWLAVGDVELWSSRALGTVPFGTGTPGCAGPHLLVAKAPAYPNSTLELRVDGLGAGAFPIGLVGTNPNPAGIPFPGTGALLHVDFLTVFLIQAVTPSGSHATWSIPIPNLPNLVVRASSSRSSSCGPLPARSSRSACRARTGSRSRFRAERGPFRAPDAPKARPTRDEAGSAPTLPCGPSRSPPRRARGQRRARAGRPRAGPR
ncbi:MAG: hypothetical protein GC161_16635 [Planctomycetaceae bacterium]|nr:hypothetical protein [Planctomycetaceae bacterium]